MAAFTIRRKLALWYSLMLMLFLCAGFTLVYFITKNTLLEQSRINVEKDALTVADEVKNYRGRFLIDMDDAQEQRLTGGLLYALYDPDGKWIDGRRVLWMDDIPVEYNTRLIEHDGAEWFVLDQNAYPYGYADSVGYIRVLLPLESVYSVLNKLLITGIAAFLPCILIAGAGGLFIAGRALAPVKKITDAAKTIEKGNLSGRIDLYGGKDEVGELAATFNNMAAGLQKAFDREARFTSDVSHELRTPVTVILAHAEEALDNTDAESAMHALRVIRKKGIQMQNMISAMLTLARGNKEPERQRVDLSLITEDAASEAQANAAGITVEKDIEPGIVLMGDQLLLIRLIVNLLDNAVRYNRQDGHIKVVLRAESGRALLTVSDNGRGIAPEDLPHIFERFYRADKARSGEGSGLGLAIVEWIVAAHKGTVSVESAPGQYTRFTVSLPVV